MLPIPETPSAAAAQPTPDHLISFLKAIPDGRYRRGVRYPQWFLPLVAVLGLNFKRWPSDGIVLYLFNKAHLQQFGQVLQAWMISQIPGGADGLEPLVCDGKSLRGSSIKTDDGSHRKGLRPTPSMSPRSPSTPSQFQGKRQIPFTATDHEKCHGRDGLRGVRRHLFLTSVRMSPKGLLCLIRQRWSIDNEWHWARDAQLGEDAHRYANRTGAPVFSFLRTILMNLLRRGGDRSIRQGLRELAHDIQGMLSLGSVASRVGST